MDEKLKTFIEELRGLGVKSATFATHTSEGIPKYLASVEFFPDYIQVPPSELGEVDKASTMPSARGDVPPAYLRALANIRGGKVIDDGDAG
jgi:hypothetical protein